MLRITRLAAPALIGLSAIATALPATAASLPPAAALPVINEVDTRGPNGGNDEFIELHNPLPVPLDISGWALRRCNSADTQVTSQIDLIDPVGGGLLGGTGRFPTGTAIAGGGFLVVANTNASGGYTGAWDFQYKTGITDHTGIQLVAQRVSAGGNDVDVVVDKVGFSGVGAVSAVPNGVAPVNLNDCASGLSAVNSGSNDTFSVSRINVETNSAVGCVAEHSASNAVDYRLRPRTPGTCNTQGLEGPDPLGQFVKISEVATSGPGTTGSATQTPGNDEFIEIHNNAPVPVDLSDYTLWRCNSANTALVSEIVLDNGANLGTIPAFGTIYVNHSLWSSGTNGTATYSVGVSDNTGVRLHDGSGWRVDSVGFQNPASTTPTHPLVNSCVETLPTTGANSVNRLGGGTPIAVDTNVNAVDFTAAGRSPGVF